MGPFTKENTSGFSQQEISQLNRKFVRFCIRHKKDPNFITRCLAGGPLRRLDSAKKFAMEMAWFEFVGEKKGLK